MDCERATLSATSENGASPEARPPVKDVDAWVQFVNDIAGMALFREMNFRCLGAKVPNKPLVFLPYVSEVGACHDKCDEAATRQYEGFSIA